MSAKTGIQWTDATWNPVVGCTQVSPGCAHCYAKQLHDQRHKALLEGKMQAPQYREPFETVQLKPERLTAPRSWRKPRRIFVNSVSDLFHDDVPYAFIWKVWEAMAAAERHTFQILTKRPARMKLVVESLMDDMKLAAPLPNVWLGVSVENQRFADQRVPHLADTPAAIRFLSCEPLLGPVDLDFDDIGWRDYEGNRIDWVIVGGESGKGARKFDLNWAAQILEACDSADVRVFVKQLGANAWWCDDEVSQGGHGDDLNEWPEWLRVREFPEVRA